METKTTKFTFKEKLILRFFGFVDYIGNLIDSGWKKYDQIKELQDEVKYLTAHND